jgi:hypothetical protein
MPRFFINFRNGETTVEDDTGQDFPSLNDAKMRGWLLPENWSPKTSSRIRRIRSVLSSSPTKAARS